MILSVIKIYPPPGRGHAIIDILDSLKGPAFALPDCLGCSVSVEVGEGEAISYTEKWCTREAFDRHLKSSLYNRVLEAMECSCRPPEVEFFEVTDIGNLEMVERVRKPH